jgi:F-type H+-transporting ATPase subunit epsilon
MTKQIKKRAKIMHLKILLPFKVFSEHSNVLRIVAETPEGSFGILPQRLDCVTPLTPGILTYETDSQDQVFVAIDEGVLVKVGEKVLISVRRAISGVPLNELREAVKAEFITLDEQQKELKTVLVKLESGFLRQFSDLNKV